ncbi:hypothetical protein ACOME3_001868 [Neoechinorhynchus agilis]
MDCEELLEEGRLSSEDDEDDNPPDVLKHEIDYVIREPRFVMQHYSGTAMEREEFRNVLKINDDEEIVRLPLMLSQCREVLQEFLCPGEQLINEVPDWYRPNKLVETQNELLESYGNPNGGSSKRQAAGYAIYLHDCPVHVDKDYLENIASVTNTNACVKSVNDDERQDYCISVPDQSSYDRMVYFLRTFVVEIGEVQLLGPYYKINEEF